MIYLEIPKFYLGMIYSVFFMQNFRNINISSYIRNSYEFKWEVYVSVWHKGICLCNDIVWLFS